MDDRIERTWLIHRRGHPGPAYTVPADDKEYDEALEYGAACLRKDNHDMRDIPDSEFICRLCELTLGHRADLSDVERKGDDTC